MAIFPILLLLTACSDPPPTKAVDHGTMKMDGHGGATEPHWLAPEEEAKRKNPMAASAASIARGSQIFQTHCASCHGAGGKGDGPAGAALNPKPVDLTSMAGHHPDGDFAWKIANGRGPMPGWKGVLSEPQIWDSVNFVQSLAPRTADSGGHHHAPGHGQHKH
jgi:mono/diheme cytochrome c family protein